MPAPRDEALAKLARRVGKGLRAAGLKIATAESCTGGLLAKSLTDIAGSSDYFERGWVTYSNAAKRVELGISAALLARHGAVSEAAALAMAAGALRRSGARVAIAVTGHCRPRRGDAGQACRHGLDRLGTAPARAHRGIRCPVSLPRGS